RGCGARQRDEQPSGRFRTCHVNLLVGTGSTGTVKVRFVEKVSLAGLCPPQAGCPTGFTSGQTRGSRAASSCSRSVCLGTEGPNAPHASGLRGACAERARQ